MQARDDGHIRHLDDGKHIRPALEPQHVEGIRRTTQLLPPDLVPIAVKMFPIKTSRIFGTSVNCAEGLHQHVDSLVGDDTTCEENDERVVVDAK